ncbi:MAG: PA14 domain-containing protein [Anaerolineae bacterium]|nr:PA14 domain-containing protein [Anaerolineae bacterium]
MERKFNRRLPLPTRDNWIWWALIAGAVATVIIGGIFLTGLALRASGIWPAASPTPTPASVPSVRLSPEQGRPGAPVTVSGSGWPAGEIVTLRLAAPAAHGTSAVDFMTATVGSEGTFTASLSIPVVRPWSEFPEVRVQVAGRVSSETVTAVFELISASDEQSATVTPAAPATSTATATPTPSLTPTPTPTPEPAAWRGEYFNNTTLWGAPAVVRDDRNLDFDWGTAPPVAGVLADGFAARWTRVIAFPAGVHRFYVSADDGVRVWLDGQILVDEWHGAQSRIYIADQTLLAGDHTLVVEYYEVWGSANIRFWWDRAGVYPQWRGDYYPNIQLSGEPALTRNDVSLHFAWGTGEPANDLPADKFSIRWIRTLAFDAGTYRFRVLVDDGARLYVDGVRVINAWTNGAAREVTGDISLAGGDHEIRLDYYDAGGDAVIQLTWEKAGVFDNWRGEYWRNRSFSGLPTLVRDDESIDFTWDTGSPAPEIPSNSFSARWSRTLEFATGTYQFQVLVDDGARLWVDDRLVIDAWEDGGTRELSVDLPLAAGSHTLMLEYYEGFGQANAHLAWEKIAPEFPDWKGEYWPNADLAGAPVLVRNDRKIAFDWDKGAPDVGLATDEFSARWSRTAELEAGLYRFSAAADDGVRVSVDGDLVIDAWYTSAGDKVHTVERVLSAGQHTIVVEYFEDRIDAFVEAWFERLGGLPTETPLPTETAAPTATATPTPTSTALPTVTPEPATPTMTPTATPVIITTTLPSTVYINEVMPVAGSIDWDQDGVAEPGDAWVELYNPTDEALSLEWWVLEVEGIEQYGYRLPPATVIQPQGYLVITSEEAELPFLAGQLRLRRDAVLFDAVELLVLEPDRSLSRDAAGEWQQGWLPTLGTHNLPPEAVGRAR